MTEVLLLSAAFNKRGFNFALHVIVIACSSYSRNEGLIAEDAAAGNRPGMYCSPSQRMPFNSITEGLQGGG